ncbi:MAG: tRNA uridine-5-carboxymethylaminomethyl(34) synthesis GTPase MnmE, partial [Clostridia bacterium]|nr:tRNA uridine-5-carboxymethylaminomethyl(34) synthesis GTPase MnmE [Clostridia bacterium]
MQTDTITAISTPLGEGGVSTVRISGDDAFEIAKTVFKSKNNKDLSKMQGYTAAFGKVYDGDELLDDAVALVFRAPKSYTGEDTVEISVHGGTHLIRRVLRSVINAGARLAEGG